LHLVLLDHGWISNLAFSAAYLHGGSKIRQDAVISLEEAVCLASHQDEVGEVDVAVGGKKTCKLSI